MSEKPYKIINGNSLEVLDTFEENSIDAIITDPPYELNFMGKGWDRSGIAYNVELWKKALRVLKKGGYLLAFGGTRTFHRIACAIEDAGFEIRDTIMWLYGSGFPKSMNIGLAIDKKNGVESEVVGTMDAPDLQDIGTQQKALGNGHIQSFGQIENAKRIQLEIKKATNEWDGWGTALKPAYEPIIVARKPLEKTVIDNVLKYGVGGINIDECRIGENGGVKKVNIVPNSGSKNSGFGCDGDLEELNKGRFPSNVILTYDDTDYNEVCGGMPNTKSSGSEANYEFGNQNNPSHLYTNVKSGVHFGDEGSAARYFYCAKASKKDRDGGMFDFEEKTTGELQGGRKENSAGSMMLCADGSLRVNPYAGTGGVKKNIHPTVKPVELMQYLVRLVSPKGATILDIFNGSGSTGKAVMFENREKEREYKYIGIELDPEYCKISEARIDYALNKYQYDIIEEIKENEQKGQLSLFDIDYE